MSAAKVFSGWGASCNAVVGVGDITGDGTADLVSRGTSGNVWRNSGDRKGSFGGRTKIATGWQGYRAVVRPASPLQLCDGLPSRRMFARG